nr:MAG TPA: hypothetical protein [Caudoviricetes sp.]
MLSILGGFKLTYTREEVLRTLLRCEQLISTFPNS